MPSETMDFNNLSSSLFSSDDICSSTEVSSCFILNIFHFEHGVIFRSFCESLEI